MDSVRYEDSVRNNNAFLGIYHGKKLLKLKMKADVNVPVATNTQQLEHF